MIKDNKDDIKNHKDNNITPNYYNSESDNSESDSESD